MPGKIFISYRRDDLPGDARGGRDALAAGSARRRSSWTSTICWVGPHQIGMPVWCHIAGDARQIL